MFAHWHYNRNPKHPPIYKRGCPLIGPFLAFARDPVGTIRHAYEQEGNCFTMKMFNFNLTFLVGPECHEVFFKSSDLVCKATHRHILFCYAHRRTQNVGIGPSDRVQVYDSHFWPECRVWCASEETSATGCSLILCSKSCHYAVGGAPMLVSPE